MAGMIEKRKVISRQNLPPRAPVLKTLMAYCTLKITDAPGWAWCALGVAVALAWCHYFAELESVQEDNIFKDE